MLKREGRILKRNLKKIIVSMAVLMLLLSVLPVLAYDVPSTTHPANALWIEPANISFDTSTTSIGYKFNVTVFVNSNVSVASWQFYMLYNKNHLQCNGAWYSGIDEGTDASELFIKAGTTHIATSPSYGSYDSTRDYVLFAESYFSGPYPGPSHCPSSVAYLEFEVVSVPTKGEEFNSLLDITTSEDNYIQDDAQVYYRWIGINANYNFTWSAPAPCWFTTDDDENIFDQWTHWVGTTFDVDVVIANYYAGWGMTNATFCLSYDSTLINATAAVLNTADWTGTNSITMSHDTLDWVNATVRGFSGSQDGGASVLVATITFEILVQGNAPPEAQGAYNETALAFCDETEVWDHEYTIDSEPVDGMVQVVAYLSIVPPYLEVVPNDTTLGPAPAVGEEFTIAVNIKELHWNWYLVGVEFRLTYCPDLMQVVSIEEGDYLPQFEQTGAPQPTIFQAFDEGDYIVLMDLILPNGTGYYPDPVAGGDPVENGTIAIITFEVTAQDVSCDPEDFECDFILYDILMIDKKSEPIGYRDPVDGTYTILGSFEVGRIIDVYTQYPAPYGGQGLMQPSDMFWPQKEVILCANVTFNCWPVQQKLVTFTVWDNQDNMWTTLQAVTDEDGVACVSFRLPWPCDDPESLLGVWRVVAEVDVACESIYDELEFHYDWLVNIVEVTTDKYYYEHCEWVDISITFTSHAQQQYLVAMRVTIHDELNVPVAFGVVMLNVTGAEFCTAEEYLVELSLHIDKFVFVGTATIHAVPLFWYVDGWTAAGPEDTTTIYVLPY